MAGLAAPSYQLFQPVFLRLETQTYRSRVYSEVLQHRYNNLIGWMGQGRMVQ